MRTFSRLAIATGGALVLSLITVSLVSAQESSTDPVTMTTTTVDASAAAKERAAKIKADAKAKADEFRAAAEARKAAARQDAATKLAATKLAVCEKRQATIAALMTRIGDRGQKQLELIGAVVTRVEAFKADKGLTVTDYEAIKTEVDAQKAAAQTAIESTKAIQVEFACDGADPKGAASAFKDSMKAQHDAIKAYREAAVNLLVAVKQSQQSASTSNTEGEN